MELKHWTDGVTVERTETDGRIHFRASCPISGCLVTELIEVRDGNEDKARIDAIGRMVAHLKRHHGTEVGL